MTAAMVPARSRATHTVPGGGVLSIGPALLQADAGHGAVPVWPRRRQSPLDVVVVVGASVVVVGASVVVVAGGLLVVVVGASVVVVAGGLLVVVVGASVVVVVGAVVVVVVVGNGSGSGNSWIAGPEVVVVVEFVETLEMTLGWVVTFPGFVVEVVERETVVVVDDFGLKITILGTAVVVLELGAAVVAGVLAPGVAAPVVGTSVTTVVGTAAVSDGWLTEWNGPLR
jgi:hypothetical protein